MTGKKVLTVTLNPAIDYTVEAPGFRPGHVNRALGGHRYPGGKGINVASITSRYRLRTAVTGFMGSDNCSIFREHFERYHLDDRFIYINGNTREGIKVVDSTHHLTTDINFRGFSVDQKDIDRFLIDFREFAGNYDFIIMSGSLPEGVKPNIYAELASIAAGKGVFTAVDTSGEALVKAVDSGCLNMIKPNIHELKDAFGTDDIESSGLLSKVKMIALSMGAAGSRLYTDKGIYEAGAPDVKASNTVGAGDSFLAGFIAGLAMDMSPPEALRLATATAASKLTKAGPGWSEKQPPGYFHDLIEVKRL